MSNISLTSTFSHDNWTIKYALSGSSSTSSKTVVFVHGTPWSSIVFQPIAKALVARGYRVLLYDLPGYGESQQLVTSGERAGDPNELFKGDTSVKAQADALTALLHELQLDGKDGREIPAVVAHDIAGTIALRAHLIHGCEFESLLLLDTNTVLPWGDGFYKLVRSEPKVFLQLPSSTFEAVVRSVIQSASANPKTFSSIWEDALAEPWIVRQGEASEEAEVKRSSFVRQIAQANDQDVQEMLDGNMYESVRCPVKIMWGEQDQWIPREKMDTLAKMLGDRLQEFVVVPQAGHLLMVDQPEMFAVEVSDWLAKQKHSRQ